MSTFSSLIFYNLSSNILVNVLRNIFIHYAYEAMKMSLILFGNKRLSILSSSQIGLTWPVAKDAENRKRVAHPVARDPSIALHLCLVVFL